MGRNWESKPGENLMFSILLKDRELIERFDSVSLMSAASIYKAIKCFGVEGLSIKWPNDVYIDDKKTCGILLESITENNEIKCLIVGIGVNVNQNEFGVDTATSISNKLGSKVNMKKFKRLVYSALLYDLDELKGGSSSYLYVARQNEYLRGKLVEAEIDGKKVTVKVVGINDDNSLKVITESGVRNLKTGEITFHKSH